MRHFFGFHLITHTAHSFSKIIFLLKKAFKSNAALHQNKACLPRDASTWIQTDGSRPWEANYILQSEHICRACSAEVITITAHFNASVKSWISTFRGSLEVASSPLSRSGRQGDNLHPWQSSPAYVNTHKITLHSFKQDSNRTVSRSAERDIPISRRNFNGGVNR